MSNGNGSGWTSDRTDPTTRKPRKNWVRGIYWRYGGATWGYYAQRARKIVAVDGDRDTALDAKARDRLAFSAGLPPQDTTSKLTVFIEAARESAESRLSRRGLESFNAALRILERELGHLKPAQITPDRTVRLRRELADGTITGRRLKAATVKRLEGTFKMVFKVAVRRGAIPQSPYDLLGVEDRIKDDTPRERFHWSRETLAQLLRAATRNDEREHARQRYQPLIATLSYTGLRFGEAIALTWADVDLLAGIIHVRHSWCRTTQNRSTTKTRSSVRSIPIPDALVRALLDYKPANATDDDFVFPGRKGNRPISYWNFHDRGWRPTLKLAGSWRRRSRSMIFVTPAPAC